MQRTILAIFCLFGLFSLINSSSFRILDASGDYCDFIVTSQPITIVSPSGAYSTTYKAATGSINRGNSTNAAYSETDLGLLGMSKSLAMISYSGTNCNMRLQFFTKANMIGNWIRYNIYKNEGQLSLSSYWANQVVSYKFYYP